MSRMHSQTHHLNVISIVMLYRIHHTSRWSINMIMKLPNTSNDMHQHIKLFGETNLNDYLKEKLKQLCRDHDLKISGKYTAIDKIWHVKEYNICITTASNHNPAVPNPSVSNPSVPNLCGLLPTYTS
eukprot:715468_1